MLPLPQWPQSDRIPLHGIFTDIDDTLTTDGAITQDALDSLSALKAAGLHVIPITGRPIGWSEPFASTWPVDAIVAENGSVAFRHDDAGALQKIYQQDATTRARNYARMQEVAQQIVREVPGAMLATDSAGRETDIAIDHSEFTHLPQAAIDQAVAIMRAAGMNATVSSIHINGWFGDHNKLEGARWIVRELFGRDLDKELDHWVYVGDSTNDQLMFKTFKNSIGVANVARFVPQLKDFPKYITQGERGAGFTEVANMLLER
ncbi:HAD-IIB family hydrolase [Diaphorobacter sp. HDW4A]|uniref:HAD-IIB family hydrolase n=1 Tax=Diaphorobacter sp. HDW4A TaxID=2714924 RepID=UPI00140A38CC|nr:HAD-IIB family hydrolase [Diaphorobacter sp. HDW4A]QIL81739.1 HAD-IIB family hydrolase [Diaphorobacter sp. HDW4A]